MKRRYLKSIKAEVKASKKGLQELYRIVAVAPKGLYNSALGNFRAGLDAHANKYGNNVSKVYNAVHEGFMCTYFGKVAQK
ncbi:hypothetical protein FP76_gp091 [Bacillus phage Evoli]|uniref:Uncharacterized protein n=1 Tax=Bacillus phage Evoli TaxID=1486658 RepID=A0A024B1X8_9CAUD|nr:hypothetical protein FP76_gp091 [Bacillus phage Evoli]AHZ10003.1 hypothetical protein [Bacillus phage Evoli]